MYHHQVLPPTNNGTLPRQSHENWLELYNKSGTPIDLTCWEIEGGISYQFTPGKIPQPGAALVVADDVAALHAAYPGVDIVGNYAGKLSGKGELIALKDPVGNPADEVRYYDGGKWPVYADGGGSSLE